MPEPKLTERQQELWNEQSNFYTGLTPVAKVCLRRYVVAQSEWEITHLHLQAANPMQRYKFIQMMSMLGKQAESGLAGFAKQVDKSKDTQPKEGAFSDL